VSEIDGLIYEPLTPGRSCSSGQVSSWAELIPGTASVMDLHKNLKAFPQSTDDD